MGRLRQPYSPRGSSVRYAARAGLMLAFVVAALFIAPAPTVRAADTIALTPVFTGLAQPVAFTHAGDGSNRMFIVQQAGQILVSSGGAPTTFLDIDPRVKCCDEEGLLSVAFHPSFPATPYFYVNYTNNSSDSVIARYTANPPPNQNTANPLSELILLTIPHPTYLNHNGGQLQFGPDGYLYFGMGDGGGGGDPGDNGQDIHELLGKMLRLDVNAPAPYIPPSNPYAGPTDGLDEIWAIGLRNPWRFSFDRTTGDLIIADVGQDTWEEVNFTPAPVPGGLNYGWDIMEGTHCHPPSVMTCNMTGKVIPQIEYAHDPDGNCSVTGGYRYRGSVYPAFVGRYVYADYCSGRIWGAKANAAGTYVASMLIDTGLNISSFGEDEAGEIYAVHRATTTGVVYRIDASLMTTDTDADGCSDLDEALLTPPTNANNQWDFYSVPVPALIGEPSATRDHSVTASDAQAVFAMAGANTVAGQPNYENDVNNNGIDDGLEYDRSLAGPGVPGAPDGAVTAQDAQLAFVQASHNYDCPAS